MNKYNVGDEVWWARCDTRIVKETCPVCFGKCEVTLILGNDDRVVLPCSYCRLGYEEPRGFVGEWEWVAQPELVAITRVDVKISLDGEEREYYYQSFRLGPDVVYDTEEGARTRCEEISEENLMSQTSRAARVKGNKQESFAGSAGYHMRSAKKCRREAESHDRMAQICKARVPVKGPLVIR